MDESVADRSDVSRRPARRHGWRYGDMVLGGLVLVGALALGGCASTHASLFCYVTSWMTPNGVIEPALICVDAKLAGKEASRELVIGH